MNNARKTDHLARSMEACAFTTIGRHFATWNRLARLARSNRVRASVRAAGSGVN